MRSRAGPAGTRTRLGLQLPVRLAVAVGDGPLREVGIIAAPALRLDVKRPAGGGERWSAGLALAGVAANRRYHAYLYEVTPLDATPARPAYRARGGWGGWQATATASRAIGRWRIGAFMRYDDVGGAVFADSPLVTRRTHLSAGAAIAYVIAQSARRVESESD